MDGGAILDQRMPLQVRELRVHPEQMPLSTLQFTERLGYRPENGIAMLAMGCHNTLWALRRQLEARSDPVDAEDQRTVRMARKWMGEESWPQDPAEQERLRWTWRCQRSGCVLHADHCPHGAQSPS